MNNTKKNNEVENYEIIEKNKELLITYSLNDCTELVGVENGSIIIQEQNSTNYDLVITTNLNNELVIFKSLDFEIVKSFEGKRIIIVGISTKTNEIEEALLISKITIENKNKIKMER